MAENELRSAEAFTEKDKEIRCLMECVAAEKEQVIQTGKELQAARNEVT